MRATLRLFIGVSTVSFAAIAPLAACSEDDPSSGVGSGSDSGSSTGEGGNTNPDGGGASDASGGNDAGGGNDTGADTGADAGTNPSDPNKPATITAGQSINGTVPASTPQADSAHFYKYVPAQAFTKVTVDVTALGPSTAFGDLRWQTDTQLGLCDSTGGVRCCDTTGGPSMCHLTIREGSNPSFQPVVPGKTYYVIVIGGTGPTSYAFSLTEVP